MDLVERTEKLLKDVKNDAKATLNSFQVKAIKMIEERDDNFIVVGPTGIGKTMIGVAAILKYGKGFYLAPLRSLMREKYVEFRSMFPKSKIVITNKDYSIPRKQLKDADIRVLSPYKFIIYLDYLDPSDGVVVVDEIHKISEDPEMEAAVSAIKSMGFRVVALSATVHESDIPKMSRWLNATAIVAEEERPVPLKFTEIKLQLYGHLEVEKGGGYLLKGSRYRSKNDVVAEIVKVLRERDPSGCVLVWTPTRNEADELAHAIALRLPTVLPGLSRHVIRSCDHDSTLSHVIERGVGIHHGGLSSKNRELVEDLFAKKKLHTIVSCYTLSHGVNFPVRYLITTTLFDFNSKPLDPSVFHQIAGRAGRPGLDEFGEVIVVTVGDLESYLLTKLLAERSSQIRSKLYNRWVLTKMAAQRIAFEHSVDGFVKFLKDTYYAQEHGMKGLEELKKLAEEALTTAVDAYFLAEGERFYPKGRLEAIAASMGLHPSEWRVSEPMIRKEYQETINQAGEAALEATGVADRSVLDKIQEYGFLATYLGSWKVRDVAEYIQTILDAVGLYIRRAYGWNSQEFQNAKDVIEMYVYGGNPNARYLADVLRHDEMKRVIRNMPQILVAPDTISVYSALEYVGMLVKLIFEFKKTIYMKRVCSVVEAFLKTVYGDDVPEGVRVGAFEVAERTVAEIQRDMKARVVK